MMISLSERALLRSSSARVWGLVNQGLYFLLIILLCLVCGSFLLLPLGPPFRQASAAYRGILLPLIFGWWGIVTPLLGYWLFQQFFLCWQSSSSHLPSLTTARASLIPHLDLVDLRVGDQHNLDVQLCTTFLALYQVMQGIPLEQIATTMGMDLEKVAALILSYRRWGACVL